MTGSSVLAASGEALTVDSTTLPSEPGGEAWSAATPDDFFFSLPFLRAMSRSAVEDAEFRLLLLRDGGRPVGAAVLTRFVLSLDLLADDPWVRALRRWMPKVLDVPMICCGLPASFGQHSLHVIHGRYLEEALRRVDDEAEAWARRTGTELVLWKEWSPDQGLSTVARDRGYVVLPTLPDHVLGPLPSSPEEFLARLRSPYRRKYRRAARLVARGGDGTLGLRDELFGPGSVHDFYPGYEAVMARTPVRLETYPRAFFEALATSGLGARLLTITDETDGGHISALLMPSGDELCFLLVAKRRARYGDALYPTLLRSIVLRAVQGGFRQVRLGQTSAYAKLSTGAVPRRLETFIRLRSPWRHRLLSRLGHHLFPEVTSPPLRVFREEEAASPIRGDDRAT